MSGGLVLLFAVACGLSVANLYYAQPILDNIARTFGAGTATAGLVVTLSQIGYAVGLALLVPLGDILNRRRMLPLVLVATAVGLIASAAVADHRGADRRGPAGRCRVHRRPDARPDGGVTGRRVDPRAGSWAG